MGLIFKRRYATEDQRRMRRYVHTGPWVETHGYHHNVATRRSHSPTRARNAGWPVRFATSLRAARLPSPPGPPARHGFCAVPMPAARAEDPGGRPERKPWPSRKTTSMGKRRKHVWTELHGTNSSRHRKAADDGIAARPAATKNHRRFSTGRRPSCRSFRSANARCRPC